MNACFGAFQNNPMRLKEEGGRGNIAYLSLLRGCKFITVTETVYKFLKTSTNMYFGMIVVVFGDSIRNGRKVEITMNALK